MLAAPRLKLFYRCGEPESARWISDAIGEVEIEKPKIGTTASVEDKGRDSLNYSTVTEHKPVVSKEEIMSLADMNGYWKYHDVVIPFRLPLARVRIVAEGFMQRRTTSENLPDGSSEFSEDSAPDTNNFHQEAYDETKEEGSTESCLEPETQVEPTENSTITEPQQREFEFSIADKNKALALSTQSVNQ